MEEFDVISVKTKANQSSLTNPENSRDIYKQELMDWIDYYNENYKNDNQSNDAIIMRNKIANLWIEYANFEKSIRQYKKVVQVYEDSLNEPVTNQSIDIIISYCNYCIERNKKSNAQKIFIRGLSFKQLTTVEYDKLWYHFLTFMNKENNNQLTIQQLYEAIQLQLKDLADSIAPPSESFSYEQLKELYDIPNQLSNNPIVSSMAESKQDDVTSSQVVSSKSIASNALAEAVLASINLSKSTTNATKQISSNNDNNTNISDDMPAFVVPSIDSLPLVSEIDELDDLTGLSPETIAYIYNSKPPMLFSTADKEPMVFGLSTLTQEDIKELDSFLGVSIILLSTSSTYTKTNTVCDHYLDILQALWVTQAFKERQFDLWFTELRQIHLTDEYNLKAKIESLRLMNAPDKEIQSAENDFILYQNKCLIQRELLHAIINKTLYSILLQQQIILSNISFPSFNSSVIDKLEKCIANSKVTMNLSTIPSNPFDYTPELYDIINRQSRLVNAVLSICIKNLITPPSTNQSSNQSFGGIVNLKRTSSVESDRLNDWSNTINNNSLNNKRRKRRRKNNDLPPDNLLMQFYPSANAISNVDMNVNSNRDVMNLPIYQQLSNIIQQYQK